MRYVSRCAPGQLVLIRKEQARIPAGLNQHSVCGREAPARRTTRKATRPVFGPKTVEKTTVEGKDQCHMIFQHSETISTRNLVHIGSKRDWVPLWLWISEYMHVIFRFDLYEIQPFGWLNLSQGTFLEPGREKQRQILYTGIRRPACRDVSPAL